MMDSFFDCFNVRTPTEGFKMLKPFKMKYESIDDPRFAWLDELLNYFDEWKKSIAERTGNFSDKDRCKMFIAEQTYEGIKMSIFSLKECIPYLLNNGVQYILSERFCQDSLENYFGKQRAIGRRKDNPSVKDVGYNDNIIKTQFSVQAIAGNVRADPLNQDIDTTQLPKRKKVQ